MIVAMRVAGAQAAPAGPALAPASGPSAPAAVRPEDAEHLADILENDAARAQLVKQLRLLAQAERGQAAPPPSTTLFAAISAPLERLGNELVDAATVALDAPRVAAWLEGQIGDPATRQRWLAGAAKLAVTLGAALATGWVVRFALLRARRGFLARLSQEERTRALAIVALRSVLAALPILAFAIVALGLRRLIDPSPTVQALTGILIGAILVSCIVLAAAAIVLLPGAGFRPLTSMGEPTARSLFRWIQRFALTVIIGDAVARSAAVIGVPAGAQAFLLRLVGLALTVLAVAFVFRIRTPVARWIRGERADAWRPASGAGSLASLRARLAPRWHIAVIVYIVGAFAMSLLRPEGGLGFVLRATVLTLIVLAVAYLLVLAVRLVEHLVAAPTGDGRRLSLVDRMRRYVSAASVLLRAVIDLVALLAVLTIWGFDTATWIASPLGSRLVSLAGTLLLLVVASVIVWEALSAAIDRYLLSTDSAVARGARARTLLPLVRNAALIALIILVSLSVFAELGVNITPLLAGAGVIGLAVGFGSQTLVKDVITGLFILVENTLAVGDVVDIGGGHVGLVEAVSMRTLQLRDDSGRLHTIPFSEVRTVANMTRGFAEYVISLSLALDEPTERVCAVLRQTAEGLKADPDFGPWMLEGLTIDGVDAIRETGFVLKARLRTLPLKQWAVGREFNRRLKDALVAAKVRMAQVPLVAA
jgi:small conductance mechanosensitive channel